MKPLYSEKYRRKEVFKLSFPILTHKTIISLEILASLCFYHLLITCNLDRNIMFFISNKMDYDSILTYRFVVSQTDTKPGQIYRLK